MLLHANTRMNLTAVRAPNEAWDKHIFDALTLMPLLSELVNTINRKFLSIETNRAIFCI